MTVLTCPSLSLRYQQTVDYGTSVVIALRACALHLFQGVEKKHPRDLECARDLLKGFKRLCKALWDRRRLLIDDGQNEPESEQETDWSDDDVSLLSDNWLVDDDGDDSWVTEDEDEESDHDGDETDLDTDSEDSSSFKEPGFGETSTVCLELLIRIYNMVQ